MKIEPEDLLACVTCMTEAQKASFCELIDPAPSTGVSEQLVWQVTEMLREFDAGKKAHAEKLKRDWESRYGDLTDPAVQKRIDRAVLASAREKLERELAGVPDVHPGQRRAQGPAPDKNKKLPGMAGMVLGGWREDQAARYEQWASAELKRHGFGMAVSRMTLPDDAVPDIEPTPAEDEKSSEAFSLQRWDRARDRWKRLFGEMTIPMAHKLADNGAELETIEGMLYDKETKGRDPERCGCGCNFVIGCKGYQVLR